MVFGKSFNSLSWSRSVACVASLHERDVDLETVVLVCDNAPCHRRLETIVAQHQKLVLLRLGPYSPMLKPIENIWSKLKAEVKRNRIPSVHGPGVGEQRMVYLERIVDEAFQDITPRDYSQCAQHSTLFHASALHMEDMRVDGRTSLRIISGVGGRPGRLTRVPRRFADTHDLLRRRRKPRRVIRLTAQQFWSYWLARLIITCGFCLQKFMSWAGFHRHVSDYHKIYNCKYRP